MPADLDTLRRRLTPAQGAGSASQCDCADAADAVFELWLSEAAGFAQSRSSSQPDSAAVPAGQGGGRRGGAAIAADGGGSGCAPRATARRRGA
eukprot:SAG25_NODE_436_length_8050_cov_15.278581_5_plen_93_part_00